MLRVMIWGCLLMAVASSSSALAESEYLVIGVIHSKAASDSVALIKDKRSGHTFAARTGQAFADGRGIVVEISPRSVQLRLKEKQVTLLVGGDGTAFVGGRSSDGQQEISISGSTVEISSTYRDHIVQNQLAKVLMQAAAVPHFQGNQLNGFTLLDIEPGSVYEQVGFQSGDIVTSINGQPLIDVGSTIRLLHVLKEEASADVTVERNGAKQQLNIRIK